MKISFLHCDPYGKIIILIITLTFIYSLIKFISIINGVKDTKGKSLFFLLNIFAVFIPNVVPKEHSKDRMMLVRSVIVIVVCYGLLWMLYYFGIGCK